MKTFKVGLVSEGCTDHLVIKTLLSAHLNTIPELECNLEFIDLQPHIIDATSRKYSDGGWEQVYKWCLANPAEERRSLYLGSGLFDDDMDPLRCDLLVVHMDADISEQIGDKSNIVPVPNRADGSAARGTYIKAVVNTWLWPDNETPDGLHIIAAAVESTEAWLVAGLTDEITSPETYDDIQTKLAILDHTVIRKKPVPPGIKSPKKTISNFQKIADAASANIERIRDRCPHFETTASEITAAMRTFSSAT